LKQSSDLIFAVLQEHCRSEAQADAILAAARRLDVDPLDFCMHRYGLGAKTGLERAAHWAGLAFSPMIPITDAAPPVPQRIEGFATARSHREKLYDRELLYIAPGFDHLLRLAAHVRAHPEARRSTCITPASAIRAALARRHAGMLLDDARQRLSRRWPHASAALDMGRPARLILLTLASATAILAVAAPVIAEAALLPLFGLLLAIPAGFRVSAIAARAIAAQPPAAALDEAELPVYSVLIPLRDEAHMVPLLEKALTALRYPPEKLDIKFVVEATSGATIAAVAELLGDARFELIVVPDAPPFTKPKALDYALPFARGQYLVVYDAEDIPDPDQLRLAAAAFAADPGIDCLQAELLIDNARENALTGLFAGEYAAQFGIVMPELVRWGLPVPLGGTSNHFRIDVLREIGGWDPFNVTEDADLGVRLARLGRRTAMLASQTYEEAPVDIAGWMRQRTRWMKGWMQVFLVHNSHPLRLLRDLGWRGLVGFEIQLGALILSPLLHSGFLLALLYHGLAQDGPLFRPGEIASAVELAVLVLGYGSSIAVVAAGLMRLGQHRLLLLQLLLPLYWILHAVATLRAGYELMTRPHFWAKTAHGLTRLERSFSPAEDTAPAEEQDPPGVAAKRWRIGLRI
jgi:hypothetical protein